MARQKIAETLTKSWLMAVRRGFVQTLNPTIVNFDDVLSAFRKLDVFIDRLEQQVTRIRRGPLSSLEDSDEARQLQEGFKRIKELLEDAASKARGWQDEYEGRSPFPDPSRKADADRMLELYRTKFAEILEGHVRTRGRGPGGTRSANIMEFFDAILKVLYADAKRIQEHRKVDPNPMDVEEGVPSEFMIHGVKVVFVDPTMRPGLIRQYVDKLQYCYKLLQDAKVASAVWYGIIFVGGAKAHVLSPEERNRYRSHGYDITSFSGTYDWQGDAVNLWVGPTRWMVEVLAHELGHRYWFKGMTGTQRGKFRELIDTKVTNPEPLPPVVKTKEDLDPVLDSIQKAEDAFKASIGTLRYRGTKFRKLLEQLDQDVRAPIREFTDAMFRAQGTFEVRGEPLAARQELTKLIEALSRKAFYASEEVNRLMLDTPEPTGPVENLDRYWTAIFKEQSRVWFDQLLAQAKDVAQETALYVRDAMLAGNNRALKRHQDEVEVRRVKQLVRPVSSYGETNEDEAFAEVFMHYVMRRDMTSDQLESFRAVIKRASAEVVLERFLACLSASALSSRELGMLPQQF